MVNGEMLKGRKVGDAGVAAFLGVPFAASPVGELRWRAPQPYQPQSASRDAGKFAPACMQTMRIVDWYRDLAELSGADRSVVPDLEISEDCLYLNIWSPAMDPEATLPVMVYVHGGSNRSGWPYEPNYHGQELARQGIVVVSVAYRLGDFGFFAHPDLDTDRAVANFALWDLLAALEWIQAHIGTFGGDAGNVTLFGESAGAANIVALMLSGRADALFHGTILQSTAGFGLAGIGTLDDERRRGLDLAAVSTASPLSIEELRRMPATQLLERSEAQRGDYYHAPVIDGELLDAPVAAKLAAGEFKLRPLIIGTNRNEWLTSVPGDADREYLEAQARELFGERFAVALAALEPATDARRAADRLITAARMLCPSQYLAEAVSAGGADVWMYWFSRQREGAIGEQWGAYHGTELAYTFGTHDAWVNTTATDLGITEDAMSYWARFAASGDPNGGATVSWPSYASPDFPVLQIDSPPGPIERPDAALCRIYKNKLLQQ